MDMDAVPDPLTTAEGVAEFVVLAELSMALSERLDGWSTDGADPDSSATMASLAARLGGHSTWWTERIPESVLLEGERAAASGSGRLAEVLGLLDVAASDRSRTSTPTLVRSSRSAGAVMTVCRSATTFWSSSVRESRIDWHKSHSVT